MSVDALFVSPHPDDVELFCGGTIARLRREGFSVLIVDLTSGEKASNGTPELRQRESEMAREILGVELARVRLGLPDGGLDEGNGVHRQVVRELLEEVRPQVVFAPVLRDRHPDHVAAHLLVRGAVESSSGARPRVWNYPCHVDVTLSVLVDVGSEMEIWEESVASYASQFQRVEGSIPTPINEPDFVTRMRDRRIEWGKKAGCEYAEAYTAPDFSAPLTTFARAAQLLEVSSPPMRS